MKKLGLKYNDFISALWCHSPQPSFEKIEEKLTLKISELYKQCESDGLRRSELDFLKQLEADLKIVQTEAEFWFYFDFCDSGSEFESNYGKYVVKNRIVTTEILYNYD